jgi:D-serine ammonia-lyase
MSKDTGPSGGYGSVVAPQSAVGWQLGRISQEHGTLVRTPGAAPGNQDALLVAGDVLRLVPQHACLTAAQHAWYYVVENGGDEVVDVWVPWKGW